MIVVSSLLLVAQIGSVAGTLRDLATGEALAGVVVTVVDLDRSTVTDADGRYRLERLPPGSHTLLVRRIGYAPRTLQALVPPDGAVELTIALSAEPIVLGAVDRVDIERPPPPADRRVAVAALRDHPLLAEPDVFQALTGSAVALQPEAPNGLHVRGGGSDQVAYLIDGVPVFSPYHSGEAFSAWNPDALAGVELRTASEAWDALSGVVEAATRAPGDRHSARAGFSTTQLRLTLDGPVGSRGAGYLFSQRSAFPGFSTPQRDPAYLHAESGDRLAKVEMPLATGRIRLLGYDSGNELDAAGLGAARNTFTWHGRSLGAEWKQPSGSGSLRARVWLAGANAGALWNVSDSVAEQLTARRHDAGVSLTLERARTAVGVRVQKSRMVYRTPGIRYDTHAPLIGVFADHSRSLGARVDFESSLGVTAAAGAVRLNPRTTLYWKPGGLTLSVGIARLHQFTQSLRNPESVVGTVLPADLFVSANRSGIPIARSDQGIVAAEYRPASPWRIGVQGFLRSFSNLALVAPSSADPFATGPVAIGSGQARGLAFELGATTAHLAAVASYGLQQVRFRYQQTSYVPDYGVSHAVDAGVTAHLSRMLSLRLATSGRFGRRATSLITPFQWEPCNVGDLGCEFAGSPRTSSALGATKLPAYIRVDVGVRARWDVRLAGQTSELAVFGTLTNVFAHTNVLTTSLDPSAGTRTPVTMRPRAPLVIGVDWVF
jgi:hypothetical protein